MFFSKPGKFEKCNMFTSGHLVLIIITIILIIIAVLLTKTQDKKKIRKIIQATTITAWILEIIKIVFNFSIGYGKNPNTYLPCYYCSLLLYAGILSSIGKGKVQRFGDVFLETGAIIAGITFMLFPTTSLPEYPAFHFISIHSFFFHGLMIYLGIIMNLGKYCILKLKDIKYYASLIIGISIFAYIMNLILGTNLMFISKDFPNTPLSPIYRFFGKYYGLFMILIQSFPPFYLVYFIVNTLRRKIYET